MAIITLSRGTFSGARKLAHGLADILGYKLVSREDLIEKTARYGLSPERLERAQRRRLGMLPRIDLEWFHYLVYSRAALTKEIRQGSLVYLGSNGGALLRDFPNVLNVKVVADMEDRIDNLIKRTEYAMDRKKARRVIEKVDERSARWHKTLHDDGWHGNRPNDEAFDLVIEQGTLSIPEVYELVQATLEQPKYQTTYKTLEAIDLLTVAAELRAKIAMKPDIVDGDVEVGVQGGVIVVKGSVRSIEDLDGIMELFD